MGPEKFQEKFNVLLVEDNPGDARLIQETLAETEGAPFALETADRLSTALQRLANGGIDAVLLDLALPDSSGQDTFEQAKAHAPSVPIIILTGLGDEALALRMVREGAQDYVAKTNLDGNLLARAIRYAIERERAEQQIRRFNEELEDRVRQRTRELEAANKELEAFSYSVSHDLRAPLRHIDGFAHLLLESDASQLSPEGQQCVGRIQGAVQDMAAIIDGLLKLAKCGRQPLKLQTANLTQIVERVLGRLKDETQGRQIDWKIGALTSVECDQALMEQVFANLLSNAVKYTKEREKAVIEIGENTVEEESVIFVRDNGAGFDMKHAGKLFDAFQRLHSDQQFEGAGIGLATVRRIIQKHGGRVWAEAEPEKGATFYFTASPAPRATTPATQCRA